MHLAGNWVNRKSYQVVGSNAVLETKRKYNQTLFNELDCSNERNHYETYICYIALAEAFCC